MLLKIFVVIWFLKILTNFFTRNYICRNVLNIMSDDCKKNNLGDGKDKDNYTSEQNNTLVVTSSLLLGMLGLEMVKFVVEIIVMLSLIRLDSQPFTLAFIAFNILHMVYVLITAKSNTKKENNQKLEDVYSDLSMKMGKIGFISMLLRLLNLSYWGYAIYLLFF